MSVRVKIEKIMLVRVKKMKMVEPLIFFGVPPSIFPNFFSFGSVFFVHYFFAS